MGLLASIKNFFCDLFGIETKEDKAKLAAKEQSSPEYGMEEDPASDEEKEEKEHQWDDVNKQSEFVCQGGKAQCTFCNPPISDLIVTSDTVMLQDKPFVTVKDKDGKVNFNFTGVCMHPSQQKPGAPPPPCKSIISLGEWKDFSGTMINDDNALIGKSTIPCMISGQDITIIDSGQIAELGEVKPKTKREPQIIEAYWINEDGERIEKIPPNKRASLVIETKDYRKSDNITIRLPIDGEDTEFVTHVNSKGIAILKNVLENKNEKLKKRPRIVDLYWRDSKGNRTDTVSENDLASLYIKTEGYEPESEIEVELNKDNCNSFKSGQSSLKMKAIVDENGVAILKNKEWV